MICVSLFVLEQAAEERERILDHYNIALENPVTILHQEQAKTFFCQKDAENSLWKFLMASTQMKSIQDEYRDSRTQLELAQAQLHEKRKHLEDAKQELKELRISKQILNFHQKSFGRPTQFLDVLNNMLYA